MILRFAWHPTAYIYVLGLAAVLLSLVSFANATGCQNYGGGSNCPPQAPCCQSGWCSNAQSFCSLALGCQPENSFDDNTCLSLPQCVSFREVSRRVMTAIRYWPFVSPWFKLTC